MRKCAFVLILGSFSLINCASQRPYDDFLKTDHKEWNLYLNLKSDWDLDNIPLGSLVDYKLAMSGNWVFNPNDETLITLHEKNISIKEALYLIATKYNLDIKFNRTWNPSHIIISRK